MSDIKTLIENLSAEYKTNRKVTAECKERFHISFRLEDDGTVSYDDEWLVYSKFKQENHRCHRCFSIVDELLGKNKV